MPPPPTCRFAPSPNGPLHLGHAYSALRNAAVAARLGGKVLLRQENIDIGRCTPAWEAAIVTDLRWLGLAWDGPVRRQSEHRDAYHSALQDLATRNLLFPCFCHRRAIAEAWRDAARPPRDPDGGLLYPGTCRHLDAAQRAARMSSGHPFSLRLDMAAALATLTGPLAWTEYREGDIPAEVAAEPARWGDAVLRRMDVPGSYHIAVVVDDAAQGVTDVVRGMDLFASTALHRCLQALLGLPVPRYRHHRLLRGPDGGKLAKSRGAPALAALRATGLAPADVEALIAHQLAAGDQGSSVVSQ